MTKDRIREFANKNQYNAHNLNTEKRNWGAGNLRELCNTNKNPTFVSPQYQQEREDSGNQSP